MRPFPLHLTTRLLPLRTRPHKSQPVHTTPHPPAKSPKPNSSLGGGHNPASTSTSAPGLSGLDLYNDLPNPINSIEALYDTHFLLTSGTRTAPGSGVFLLNDSVFSWTPAVTCKNGIVGFGRGAWGVLEVVWPKPGLSYPSFLEQSFLWWVGD